MEGVTFDLWSLLFLIAAVQGFFLSGMIFIRKRSPNFLLGALILAFSLMLLFYVGYWTGFNTNLHPIFRCIQGFTLLLGPMLYTFIQSNAKKLKFNFWHLTPFFIYIVLFINVSQLNESNRSLLLMTMTVFQISHLLIYCTLIYLFLKSQKQLTNGALKRKQWKMKLAHAFSGYATSFLLYYILVWTGTIQVEYDYMISAASTFFIYFIGYYGFQKPELFKMAESARYEKSSLTENASLAILQEIKTYFENKQPYLRSDLKQTDIAHALNFSIHQISQVLNEIEQKSFTDFVNSYRITLAKKLLVAQPENKIIHIAYDSGFNNKASFNNAFKKVLNMTPTQYKENQLSIIE